MYSVPRGCASEIIIIHFVIICRVGKKLLLHGGQRGHSITTNLSFFRTAYDTVTSFPLLFLFRPENLFYNLTRSN